MAEPKAEEIPINPESEFFVNIAESLDEKKLDAIAEEMINGFDADKDSLTELEQTRDEYDRLFNLKFEEKNSPWENAANIKLPVITTAATNFWARTSINLFPADNRIVNVLPLDNSDDNLERAKRVKKHMNWQLMTMEEFFQGFSKSLMMLPKDGYAFRKTYWDSNLNKVISVPVLPQNFIVNYYTTDLTTSMRHTQVLHMTVNEIKLKIQQGIFLENDDIKEDNIENPVIDTTTEENKRDAGQSQPTEVDYATPKEILEIHTYLHIGDDEIRRPFIVTIDKESRKILRIIDRRNPISGDTMHYFTNYSFITNPNSIFGYGFGSLLLGATSTMNTAINQLLDAGTLSNQRGGWVLKGSQMNRGDQHFTMGEFRQVSVRNDDIRKSILPLEFSPPSQVLLNLIQFLQDFVEGLTSVSDIMTGVAPKSDTTATGATLAVEQGQKVFTSIQLGIHRSFKNELLKIYTLNGIFLDQTEYINIVSDGTPEQLAISIDDYSVPLDIIPFSDPNVISDSQIVQKAEFMNQVVLSNPFLAQDPTAQLIIMRRRLEAAQINQQDIEKLSQIMETAIQNAQNQQMNQLDQSQLQLKDEQSQLEGQLTQ